MSIDKFFNHFYNGTVPEGTNDRYYVQDLLRDFWFLIDRIGMSVDDVMGQIPILINGGVVSQGSGLNLDISAGFGYAEYQVEIPTTWVSTPPAKTTANLEAINISWTAQTNMNLSSSNCSVYSVVDDGVTVHYVKVRFDHLDLNQREKKKDVGTNYYYEQEPSFDFQVNSTSPTSQDLCLATFTSSGGVYTFSEYSNHKLDYPTISELSDGLTITKNATTGILVSNWTERSNPKNASLKGITWSPNLNLFCAVGNADGADAYIATSPDGITWTERSNPKNFRLNYVCWSPDLSLFCAVGQADGTDAYIVTSSNGITWTERSNPKNFELDCIVWSPDLSLFCAVGANDGTDAYIITSPDGITWTERSNPNNIRLYAVEWSSDLGIFCAVGEQDGVDARISTSPDGINWTERSNPKSTRLLSIAWASSLGIFCAGGATDGVDTYIVTSPDGINWTERSDSKVGQINNITWSPEFGIFCTGGPTDGTDAYIITSPDGANWTERSNPRSFDLYAITWSPAFNMFCAVGLTDGTDAYILTSLLA